MTNTNYDLEQYIHKFVSFSDLVASDITKLVKTAKVIRKASGDILHVSEYENQMLYLIAGVVEKHDQQTPSIIIKNNTPDALNPLFSENERSENYIKAQENCDFIYFNRQIFNCLIENKLPAELGITPQNTYCIKTEIYNEIAHAIDAGTFKLPSLPEIALRIKKAVEQSDIDIALIAKIVELDPAISARIIKIANSPLSRGVEHVHSIRDAIVRLGLKMTRNLVLSFSVADLFKTRHPFLKKQMKIFYAHSIEIASICHVLAMHIDGMEADELLLAGLIHDIGRIPVINYIEQMGLEVSDEKEIMSLIESLNIDIGNLVIKSWDLPDEMLNIVTHAEDWLYDGGENLKAEDVVIVAHVYDKMRRKQLDRLPDLSEMPALQKIFPEKHQTRFVMHILDEAKDEIKEVKSLLGL